MGNYSDALIVNNLIVSNTATSGGGGGIYVLVPSGRRGPYIINNTFAYNFGTTASGIYSDGFDKDALLANNIIVAYGNQTALYIGNFNDANQPLIRYNDLFSSSGLAFGGLGANPVGTNGNISSDPLFLNPPLKNYHLRTNSVAIEAGLNSDAPTNDFDYVLRPYDADGNGTNQVDLGAYEWRPTQASLLAPSLNGNHQATVSWISSGGARYRIQYRDGSPSGPFTDIARSAAEETDPSSAGAASVMLYLDTNSPATQSRFYRIRTLSQP